MTQTRKRRQQNIIIEKGEKEAPAKPTKKKVVKQKKKRRVNEQTKRACVIGDDSPFEDCKHASLLCSTQKKVHSFSRTHAQKKRAIMKTPASDRKHSSIIKFPSVTPFSFLLMSVCVFATN